MGIINTGVFDTEEIFKRATGNDWPVAEAIIATGGGGTDLTGNTTTDLAEGANLYFTNTRVQTYLDDSGYQTAASILANVVVGIDLSGNTTTDLAEGANLYFTNARVLTALSSATIPGNITVEGTVAANSFTSTGFGIPTIEAETNIVLSANGYNGSSVVIQNSPIRIRSYTEANLSSLTPGTGDVIYNSTISKLQVYSGSAWANVGGTPDAVIDLSSINANILPSVTEIYNLGSPDKKWKDLYLSGNTIVLGNVTLSDQGGRLKLDSVEAGEITIDRLALYTAGRGISISGGGLISTSADDSELYDIGIDKQVTYFPTNSMENAFTIPASAGFRYLIQSFVVTNISASEAIFDCDIQYRGNTFTYANNFVLPFGYSIDLIDKPEIFLPNTVVSMKAAANNTLSTYVIYKTVDDTSYDSQFSNVAQSDTFYNIYTASQAPTIVENIKVVNAANALLRGTVILADSNNIIKAYISANTLLAKQYYTDTILRPLRMELGDSIKFSVFGASYGSLTTFVTARLGEVYNVTPNVTTVNEGGTVRFAITTLNVPSNTTRYYRTSGNVSTSDFVEGNTGSFLVVDGAANVILTLSADSSYDENDEIFRLQILTGSTQGPVLKESEDVVLIKDTSNVTVVQNVSISSNLVYTTESVRFTLNTINGEGNAGGTFYYTVSGNAEIFSSTSGTIIINNNTANVDIITEASVLGTQERQFNLQIRKDSISGQIVLTTSNVTIRDINTFPYDMTATGGIIEDIDV